MKAIDPQLLERLVQRAALEVAAEMYPGMSPSAIETYANGLVQRDWFRSSVRAGVDMYRHWREQDGLPAEPEPEADAPASMVDLEQMLVGRQALDAVRERGVDTWAGVHLAWVVPEHMLRGVSRAYGLPVIRTTDVTRACLGIQWDATPPPVPVTPGDEQRKDA